MNTKLCITRQRCGLNGALKLTVTPESAVTHKTAFPGPVPWLGGGAGKGPGIGWSRAHLHPEILGKGKDIVVFYRLALQISAVSESTTFPACQGGQ